MQLKFSDELLKILEYSGNEALRTGSQGIGVDHLMLGMLRHAKSEAVSALKESGIDPDELKKEIDAAVFSEKAIPYSDLTKIKATRPAKSVISMAAFEALKSGGQEVFARHLLLAISLTSGNISAELLLKSGATHEKLAGILSSRQKTQDVQIKFQDIAGALSEQLGNILGSSGYDGFLN